MDVVPDGQAGLVGVGDVVCHWVKNLLQQDGAYARFLQPPPLISQTGPQGAGLQVCA